MRRSIVTLKQTFKFQLLFYISMEHVTNLLYCCKCSIVYVVVIIEDFM